MTELAALDQFLAAPLCGQAATWGNDALEGLKPETVTRRMLYHGLAGLLDQRRDLLINWPSELLEVISQQSRAQAFWELRHKALVATVIEIFAQEGISSVVLKGTAIAYSFYDQPYARKRGDTDLLISETLLSQATALLQRLGWQSLSTTHGTFGDMQYQDLWQFTDPAGYTHDLDLHWQLTNSVTLKHVLDVDGIMERATALPNLSASAQAPDPVNLIIHGCINQARHEHTGYYSLDRQEFGAHRLIWAHDLKLLSASLTQEEWRKLAMAAQARGISKICIEALDYAAEMLGVHFPEEIRSKLAAAPHDTPETRYLSATSGFKRALGDLRSAPGFSNKFRLVIARTFPAPALLRIKYPDFEGWPIGLLYAKRIADAFFAPSKKS